MRWIDLWPAPAVAILLIALGGGPLSPSVAGQETPAGSGPAEAATPSVPSASENSSTPENPAAFLARKQAVLAEKYQRLEDVLLRVAEIEGATNPRRAELLRQALRQSKDRVTLAKMKDISAWITRAELTRAVEGQQALTGDLKELLALLLSEDRFDRNREEQDRLKSYIQELERLIRIERGLRGQTQSATDPTALKDKQGQTAERTGNLSQQIAEDGVLTDGPTPEGDPADGSRSEGDGREQAPGDQAPGDPRPGDAVPREPTPGEPAPSEGQPGDSPSGGMPSDPSSSPKSAPGSKPDEAPGGDQPSGEKPGGDKPSDDTPSEDEPASGTPSDGSDRPPSDPSGSETPEGSKPGESPTGEPNGEKPSEAMPSDGSSEPSEGSPSESQPSEGQPSDSTPPSGSPSEGGPSGGPSPATPPGPTPPEQPKGEQNPIKKRIQAAEQKMRDAEQKLEQAKRDEAIRDQEEAEELLRQAKAELEEILRQLREEEMERMLTMLESRLTKMLEMQVRVYDDTQRIDRVPAADRTAEYEIEAGKLAFAERKILAEADQTLNLLKEEGSSVAFPQAMETVRDDVATITERLGQAKTDRLTQGVEEDVIAALEEMIEAVRQAQRDLDNPPPPPPPGEQQQGQPGDRPLVDRIQELKMVRSLQLRVNNRTVRVAEMLDDPEDRIGRATDVDLQGTLRDLSEREQKIHGIAREIILGNGG